MNTVTNALACIVVGLRPNAEAILDSLLPQLKKELRTESWIQKKGPFEGTEILNVVAKAAHVGHWLKYGKFDLGLAESALRWRHALESFWKSMGIRRLTQPNILAAMLLEIESERPDRAIQVYESNEKSPFQLPPRNMRFTSNARSVLYLHLKTAKDAGTADLRSKALASFLKNATQWDRAVDPLPYVMQMDVARIARACWCLKGEDHSIPRVIEAVH